MATIHREIPIDSTVDAAWSKLSDLGQVHGMLSILSDAVVEDFFAVAQKTDERN